jgi:hypothetical protein
MHMWASWQGSYLLQKLEKKVVAAEFVPRIDLFVTPEPACLHVAVAPATLFCAIQKKNSNSYIG